jgi:putative salt-induced outer membrane protein
MMKRALIFGIVLGLTTVALAEETPWKKDISIGYDSSSGNTEKSQLNLAAGVNKGFTHSDFLTKFDFFYSSSNEEMDGQKWLGLTRYSLNFGKDDRWFNPYQFQADHDRFADIKVRYLPSVGIGYWFFKNDDFKWSLEDSIGYEITNYYVGDDKESVAMIIRTFLDKLIFGKSHITEDFSLIPSLTGAGTRIKSETGFTNPLTEGLDLTLRYIYEYDTDPAAGKEKADTRFVAGLKYGF